MPIDRRNASAGAAARPRKDPLLSAVCHDLRAPLAAVTMGANYVLQTTPEDEANVRSRRVLLAMLRSCKQMERLVRDFGDLAEIEQNALELRSGIHDARQLIEMVAVAEHPNAELRNVTLRSVRAGAEVLLRCDGDRMRRALGHILENAIRHAPTGSEVVLSAREDAGEVHFDITDSGPGLSSETLENLYDRFWHGKRADRVGTGLGMAIVRGIVTAHGGRMELSTEPGSTTFSLLIPRDVPSARNLPASG